MVSFSTTIQKYFNKGEKSGWTFIEITPTISQQLLPNNKKGFRVKGFINEHPIHSLAALPLGNGSFVFALNKNFRTITWLKSGDKVLVKIEIDKSEYQINNDFLECLSDEPLAFQAFNKLSTSNKNYYSKWIEQAKTPQTMANRIAKAITGLSKSLDFGATTKLKE